MLFALLFFDYCEGFCPMRMCVYELFAFFLLWSYITSILLGIVLSHPKEPSSFHKSDLYEIIVQFRNLYRILTYLQVLLYFFHKLNSFSVT